MATNIVRKLKHHELAEIQASPSHRRPNHTGRLDVLSSINEAYIAAPLGKSDLAKTMRDLNLLDSHGNPTTELAFKDVHDESLKGQWSQERDQVLINNFGPSDTERELIACKQHGQDK